MIYLDLFLTFFKIGLFTFGGGYAMIPMIRQDVIGKGWLVADEVNEFIGIAESTPGPFAINIATFVGMNEGGILGALCTTLGVVLPSFIIIYVIARLFSRAKASKHNRLIDSALSSVRPIVVGLIGVAFIDIFLDVCLGGIDIADSATYSLIANTDYIALTIGFVMFVMTRITKKFSPILVVLSSALMGMGLYYLESLLSVV